MLIKKELKHHGVLGQKWGVRRSRAELDAASPDAKAAAAAKSKIKEAHGTHVLSNQELQGLVTRMNLEQQYSRLANEKDVLDKGHSAVKRILSFGKTIAEAGRTAQQINKLIEEAKK